MLPSSLLGAVLFLFLLVPGLAYVLRRERAIPEIKQSAFRETLQVVAASAASLFVAGLLFAGVRAIWPDKTLNIRGLLQSPTKFVAGHHVQVIWWAIALLATATMLAWLAADPRLKGSKLAQSIVKSRIVRLAIGPSGKIKRSSAWHVAAHLYDDDPGLIHVGAQLDDKTYVAGYLDHFSIDTNETADRDMLLHGPLELVTEDGKRHDLEASYTIISARRIVRLDVTPLPPSAKAERRMTLESDGQRSRWPMSWRGPRTGSRSGGRTQA